MRKRKKVIFNIKNTYRDKAPLSLRSHVIRNDAIYNSFKGKLFLSLYGIQGQANMQKNNN